MPRTLRPRARLFARSFRSWQAVRLSPTSPLLFPTVSCWPRWWTRKSLVSSIPTAWTRLAVSTTSATLCTCWRPISRCRTFWTLPTLPTIPIPRSWPRFCRLSSRRWRDRLPLLAMTTALASLIAPPRAHLLPRLRPAAMLLLRMLRRLHLRMLRTRRQLLHLLLLRKTAEVEAAEASLLRSFAPRLC